MTIHLGADHRGFERKNQLKDWLVEEGRMVVDQGAYALDPNDDYPEVAKVVADWVSKEPEEKRGILLCGNAEGVAIVANKFDGIRAGIGYSLAATKSARNDDDINVLCLPADGQSFEDAKTIITAFLETPFEGAPRHTRRVEQIKDIEKTN